jgi:hypothetical protein
VSTHPRSPSVAALLALTAALAAPPAAPAEPGFDEAMDFAAEMAKQGNWREARYRWQQALTRWPNHRKILNNLAVAAESMGELEQAREYYTRAMSVGQDEAIESNYHRARWFWRQAGYGAEDGEAPTPPAGAPEVRGKTMKVAVRLPVPARLDITGVESILVVSFLTDSSSMLDVNRELVRYLRSELHKNLEVEILPVTPPPAVPEQTLEDLIANQEFWKFLGREYGADLIVSGSVDYDREDASGFQDVDVISSATGQKVRTSQFVEQERFLYVMNIILMDGASGELRYRDHLRGSSVFRGTQNDPITAFYELNDTLAPDVLAIVKQRWQEDLRYVFRR